MLCILYEMVMEMIESEDLIRIKEIIKEYPEKEEDNGEINEKEKGYVLTHDRNMKNVNG